MKTTVLLSFYLASMAVLTAASPEPLPDDPACTDADRVFMQKAYDAAADAVKKGSAPFGAVLVIDGKVVAEAGNDVAGSHDPTRHAELALISTYAPKISREDFRRATLYASSEPCIMCSGAILNSGVMRVVYGTTEAQFQKFINPATDKNPLTSREIIARTYPEIKVCGPLMEKEGLAQHAAYWPEAMKKWRQP
jgi:tRNA(Arg) A34 adenosine deaminase TadA